MRKLIAFIKEYADFITLILLGIIGVIGISMMSCNTPEALARKEARNAKKAGRLFNQADNKSHATVADKCGERFPPVASTRDEIIPGETVYIHDTSTRTVEVKGDSVFVTIHDTLKIRRTDTIRKTVVEVNNAALYASQDSNKHLKDLSAQKDIKIATMTQSRDGWRVKALWAWGIIAAIIVATIIILYLRMKGSFIRKAL